MQERYNRFTIVQRKNRRLARFEIAKKEDGFVFTDGEEGELVRGCWIVDEIDLESIGATLFNFRTASSCIATPMMCEAIPKLAEEEPETYRSFKIVSQDGWPAVRFTNNDGSDSGTNFSLWDLVSHFPNHLGRRSSLTPMMCQSIKPLFEAMVSHEKKPDNRIYFQEPNASL